MILRRLIVGPLAANCYILAAFKGSEAAVIDPGAEGERILKAIEGDDLKLKYIINTHGHCDHFGACDQLAKATGAKIFIHADDAELLEKPVENLSLIYGAHSSSASWDELLKEGQIMTVGELKLKILHTPGHTRGSISILVDDLLFTGDLLFKGSVGRTDFPSSSWDKLMESLKKIISLPDSTKIYPGHGPETTLIQEKELNPFLQGL
ncbi:MAG: MBL fold metallo-hydrolase [Actinomycetota bacterium]